jgi:hypothetical protein
MDYKTKCFSLHKTAAPVALALFCIAMLVGTAVVSANSDAASPADEFQANPAAGKGVMVHTKFGGQILGFDIDQSGTEGVFSEYVAEQGGKNLVATETFDQKTGKILKVVAKQNETENDYATEGVFGNHLGLVLYQHVVNNQVENHFLTMDPLDTNKFTGKWTPPVKQNYILWSISTTQGTNDVAVLELAQQGGAYAYLYDSNIAANTFGKPFPFNDPNLGSTPLLAYDTQTNQGVLAGSNGSPTTNPIIATIDLSKGKVREFTAQGVGTVNGLAVDSTTGTAVFTTQGGPQVPPEIGFYNLAKQRGFAVGLPGSDIGLDVEFDPIHKLFLVAAVTNIENHNFSILVYDEKGNLKETIPGFDLPISPTLIALNPGRRIGYVFGDNFAESLQSFTY